ncbi:MAG: glycosyltransferase [Chloroflexota bacterium]
MNSKSRILHVIDNTVSGGAQKQLESIFNGLHGEYSFSVAVLGRVGKYTDIYKSLGVAVYQIKRRSNISDVSSFPVLINLIRREKPDLIHAHLFKSMIFSALASRFTNTSCILHDHSGLDPDSLKFYFPNFFFRTLYSSAFQLAISTSTRLLGLTPEICNGYVQYFHTPESKVEMIPNAIDLERLKTYEASGRMNLRTELGLADSCKMIVMVGRLAPEKDWLTFLKVAGRNPDPWRYAFVVVGVGGLEKELRKTATDLGLANVHFVGDRQDVPSILKAADLFLLTSSREAFGIVLLEAMAADCPVIATRTAGPAAIIQSENNGLLVEAGDVDGFVTNLGRVLSDANLAARLIHNARISLQQYDLPVVSKRLSEIYTQVLKTPGVRLK